MARAVIEYIATKINLKTFEHEEYFLFDIDCGEAFNYRGRVSSNAFFHGGRSKSPRRNQNKTHLYYGRQYGRVEQNNVTDYISMFGPVPITRLASIWEFYDAVGYDYRRKKWI